MVYCIVDIETTGNGIRGNKITEISIFKYDHGRITEEFTSLVNPGCDIPPFITGLTGIDNHTVRDAPFIEQIADDILSITEGCVFVAHSVNFDYHVIKNELGELGIPFVRKKLCTVRLARAVFPGYRSYSLGKLCSSLGIPLENRHRARGDARATVILLERILGTPGIEKVLGRFLSTRSQEATLPPSLPKNQYDNLPQKPGVYYFKNAKGEVIYTGKANNIKKRVLGHFYDRSEKEVHMCRDTQNIDFDLSGSEFLALLMESHAIKKLFPLYNRAQKRKIQGYSIFSYEDREGILHLAFSRVGGVPRPLLTLYSLAECREYLEQLCARFTLCPKYCHLQEGVTSCDHFRLGPCSGICRGLEEVQAYNSKVEHAVAFLKEARENFIIKEKGRHPEEDALVVIKDGLYCGYGFIPKDVQMTSMEDILAFVVPQQETLETRRLIHSYVVKNSEKVLPLV
jgi:DNA polymerase-3 subunit epsilon